MKSDVQPHDGRKHPLPRPKERKTTLCSLCTPTWKWAHHLCEHATCEVVLLGNTETGMALTSPWSLQITWDNAPAMSKDRLDQVLAKPLRLQVSASESLVMGLEMSRRTLLFRTSKTFSIAWHAEPCRASSEPQLIGSCEFHQSSNRASMTPQYPQGWNTKGTKPTKVATHCGKWIQSNVVPASTGNISKCPPRMSIKEHDHPKTYQKLAQNPCCPTSVSPLLAKKNNATPLPLRLHPRPCVALVVCFRLR